MPWCVPPWVQFLWNSLSFLDFLEVYFLFQIGEVFLLCFFKYVFSFLLLLFSFHQPYHSDVGMVKVVPEVLEPPLFFLNSCFFILFWLDAYFFVLFQIVALSPDFLTSLLVPCVFSFISLCIAFICSFILQPSSIISVSILITSVLNSASDQLFISSSLSSFSGVVICSFFWAIFLCLGTPVKV